MAKSSNSEPSRKADKRKAAEAQPAHEVARRAYFHWSRHPAMGLFAVLPLWLVYLGLRAYLAPAEQNGAEVLLLQQLERFGWHANLVAGIAFALLTSVAAVSLVRNHVPWLRVAAVIVFEGLVYGVMLGPIAAAMTSSANSILVAGVASQDRALLPDIVGSIGAGIFEELVFRLGAMSLLVWIGLRTARSWALPRWVAGVFAVVVSALLFSWFHHACGESFDRGRFLFRAMAGVLLGLLMWARGYGVCVYTHTAYDIYFYLRPLP